MGVAEIFVLKEMKMTLVIVSESNEFGSKNSFKICYRQKYLYAPYPDVFLSLYFNKTNIKNAWRLLDALYFQKETILIPLPFNRKLIL